MGPQVTDNSFLNLPQRTKQSLPLSTIIKTEHVREKLCLLHDLFGNRCSGRLSHTHPDVFWVLSLCYPHHPQELIYIISRVADYTSEDYENIVHVEGPHDLVGGTLVG